MGATGSEVIDEMHQISGYSAIGAGQPMSLPAKSMSFAYLNHMEDILLAETPFHARWHRNQCYQKNISPRFGQCYAHHPKSNLFFFGFGQGSNNALFTDIAVFDPATLRFKVFMAQAGQARLNASATIVDDHMYIFGGNVGSNYLNEFIRIDLSTKEIEQLPIDDENAPSARSSAVIAHHNNRIFIWGGNQGLMVDNDIHVYDIPSKRWAKVSTPIQGLFEPGYTQKDQYCYMFGSSSCYNILRLDMENYKIDQLKPSGATPQTTINHPSLVAASNFILCFGGSSNYLYSHLFAYDISKNWWFVFHVKPTNESKKNGEITNLGLFKIPRQDSQAAFYDEETRTVYYMFGNRLEQDLPIYEFKVGKALAVLNDEDDLSQMLYECH